MSPARLVVGGGHELCAMDVLPAVLFLGCNGTKAGPLLRVNEWDFGGA